MLALTEPVAGSGCCGPDLEPGVYGDGLLTVPESNDARNLITALEWPVYHSFDLLAYNCMGDLFVRRQGGTRVGVVWLQWGFGKFIAENAKDWLARLKAEPEATSNYLERAAFDHLRSKKGPLPYGSVYCLSPLLALGGGSTFSDLDRCSIGGLRIYLSIASQTFEPEHWGEFG